MLPFTSEVNAPPGKGYTRNLHVQFRQVLGSNAEVLLLRLPVMLVYLRASLRTPEHYDGGKARARAARGPEQIITRTGKTSGMTDRQETTSDANTTATAISRRNR